MLLLRCDYGRIEKQNRLAVEKSQQQRQLGGEGSPDKVPPLDEQLKNQRQTAAAAGIKRMADGQLKTPDVSQSQFHPLSNIFIST